MRCSAELQEGLCSETSAWLGESRKKMLYDALLRRGVFRRQNMDPLFSSASAFLALTHYEYRFTIGRKGETREIRLSFSPDDFHHLAGLHKIRDNDFIRTAKRSKVFDAILNGSITTATLKRSQYYDEVADRIELAGKLKQLLESSQIVFRFSGKKLPFYSKIDADYLLECTYDGIVYVFLIAGDDPGKYRCKSLFYKAEKDYTFGQERFTLLQTVKMDPATGKIFEIYKRAGFTSG